MRKRLGCEMVAVIVALSVAASCGGSTRTDDGTPTTGGNPVAESVGSGSSASSGKRTLASASIVADLAAVPMEAIVAANRANKATNPTRPITGSELTRNGLPEVLYIGAEFCPYCAAERWALNVALSKFGTFTGLKLIVSSESDVPTFSYVGSQFTSDVVAFTPVELQGQDHEPLQDATAAQMELFQTLGAGSFPFIDFGGKAYQRGGSVAVTLLVDKTQADIAAQLAKSTAKNTDPTTIPGSVNAAAGEFIRIICGLTGDKPAKVCAAITG